MSGAAVLPALVALVLAALATGSGVYWTLKWPASQPATTSQLLTSGRTTGADPIHLARALGDQGARVTGAPASPTVVAAPNIASRLSLVGVVATGRQGGAALISIDGKPARPFRVGAKVEGDWSLKSVAQRRAVLAQAGGANQAILELPPLKSR